MRVHVDDRKILKRGGNEEARGYTGREKKDVLRKGDTRETNPPQPDGRYEMRGKR